MAKGGITGHTGSFTHLSATEEILAKGGITGHTGSFTHLLATEEILAKGGIIGPTGSFAYIVASKEILSGGDITGHTGSFTYLIASKEILSGGDITGHTGSFTHLSVSHEITSGGTISGPTGSFNNLTSSNNTYLATEIGEKVGIGTTNPTVTLDVSGDVVINGIAIYQPYLNCIIPYAPSINAPFIPSFEFLSSQITSSSSSHDISFVLLNNHTKTTNYAVFPSIYYGGTSNLSGTSNTITQLVVHTITSTSFKVYFNNVAGDDLNIYMTCLVVYNQSGTNYSKSY